MVSKASDDFPLPLGPVTTLSFPSGRSRSMPLRLFWRAPRISTHPRSVGPLTLPFFPFLEPTGDNRFTRCGLQIFRRDRVARSPENTVITPCPERNRRSSHARHPERKRGTSPKLVEEQGRLCKHCPIAGSLTVCAVRDDGMSAEKKFSDRVRT